MGKGKREITLGIDASITATGVAVIEVIDGAPTILDHTIIVPDPKKSYGERLNVIYTGITFWIKMHKPDNVIRERGFYRHAITTQTLYRVIGVTDLAVWRTLVKEVTEYPPRQVKEAVTGNGKASKEDVMKAVLRLNPPKPFVSKRKTGEFLYDDSDAIAVALTHHIKRGMGWDY